MESSRQKLDPNPRDDAGTFSRIFFLWMVPLLKKGYSKILTLEDIFRPLKSDQSESIGDRLARSVFFPFDSSFSL